MVEGGEVDFSRAVPYPSVWSKNNIIAPSLHYTGLGLDCQRHMMKHRLALDIAVTISLIMIIDIPRTWAVLGEPVSSVETDRGALSGQLSITSTQLYTIHEITTSELVVREYVFRDTIFAVAWRGRRPPNLVSLFGSYFQEYQEVAAAAASNGPRMRGVTRLQGTHVVVEAGGHPGDIRGRAYIPSLLPSGVTIEMIQ